jgi:sensor histidine kinase YesM
MANGDSTPNGNGNGKMTMDFIYKLSQIAIFPLLGAMFYLSTLINGLDKRFAVMEATLNASSRDHVTASEFSLIRERQNTLLNRLDALEKEIREHREKSNYDPVRR